MTRRMVSAVGLTAISLATAALAATYPDQSKVNLIRNYDRTTGNLTTTITGYGAVINGGHTGDQVGNGINQRMDFDITLNKVRNASKLVVDYTGLWPDDWSIYYSDTGLSNNERVSRASAR